MPFGEVSGVGRGVGVLDGVVIVKGEGAVLVVNVRRPIITKGMDELFRNYFGKDLLYLRPRSGRRYYILLLKFLSFSFFFFPRKISEMAVPTGNLSSSDGQIWV